MLRNGHLTANPLMDSLTYFYTGGTNRLDHIRDRNAGSTTHSNNYAPAVDIKDQAAGNYTYDAIGNLKSSEWMGDDNISWNVYGKVVEVEKRALAGVTSRFIHYYYDPSGNKTGETVRHGSGGTAYYNHRWYVRDAQGNGHIRGKQCRRCHGGYVKTFQTVKSLSKSGRLRWKIENEGFNEEKNHPPRADGAFIQQGLFPITSLCS